MSSAFLQCGFFHVFSYFLYQKIFADKIYKKMACLANEWVRVYSYYLYYWIAYCNICRKIIFHFSPDLDCHFGLLKLQAHNCFHFPKVSEKMSCEQSAIFFSNLAYAHQYQGQKLGIWVWLKKNVYLELVLFLCAKSTICCMYKIHFL